ncbi:MAG: carboxylating nicotinate-nucleotide diphosphorylase [Candidatus Aenigmarchaeota archaeon]|nr:carboxylating nicotinate-nucleotide diphosphorylase [Candidatus Aenigmarchaeota archaeon]
MGVKSLGRLEPTPRENSRPRLIKLAYDRSFFLVLRNPEYERSLEGLLVGLMKEDVGTGDITSDALLGGAPAKAEITTKDDGILAGGDELAWLCGRSGITLTRHKKDGEAICRGDRLFELEGPEKKILAIERTGLNLLQRMSGIATETHRHAELLKKEDFRTIVAGTRKTPWGFLDKKAVTLGGGYAHRLGLFESFLIKDNHIDALKKHNVKDPIAHAIDKAWEQRKRTVFIEIEARNLKEAIRAGERFKFLQNKDKEIKACIIMLDNFSPLGVRKTIAALKEKKLYDYVLLEASGGVKLDNIAQYAKAGVDAVSLGCLTHSARALDISQAFV